MNNRVAQVKRRVSPRVLRALLIELVLVATLAPLSACNRTPSNQSLPRLAQSPSLPNEVTLSPDQAKVVRIVSVRALQFPVLEDITGSISYTDDPALIQAESTLLGAAATYKLTQKELQRVKDLGEANGIAEKEMEQAVSDAQTADAALKAARDAVRVLGKSDAEINHMITTGRVDSPPTARAIKWAVGNLTESESPSVHKGEPLKLTVTAYPGRWFHGTVAEVYSSVDPNSHRVTLRAKVDDPGNDLRLGMLADMVVETGKPLTALSVPETGIVREGDGTMTAWTTSDGRHFRQRVVSTGLRSNGNIEIRKGVSMGDRVVGSGAIYLDSMLQATPSD